MAKARTIAMRQIKPRRSSREKIERLIHVIYHLSDAWAINTLLELITPHPAALCVGLWGANLVSTNADWGNS